MNETEVHSVDVRPWVGGRLSIERNIPKDPAPVIRETHSLSKKNAPENDFEPLVG
jgi:hypothetical protein